jgi:hypothetical protein
LKSNSAYIKDAELNEKYYALLSEYSRESFEKLDRIPIIEFGRHFLDQGGA